MAGSFFQAICVEPLGRAVSPATSPSPFPAIAPMATMRTFITAARMAAAGLMSIFCQTMMTQKSPRTAASELSTRIIHIPRRVVRSRLLRTSAISGLLQDVW
jgi:hypothetical protein